MKQYLDMFWDADGTQPGASPGASAWYGKVNDPCAGFTGQILNNLIAPGYAFLWRLTGDDTYRVRGGDMFQYQFSSAPASTSGPTTPTIGPR